MRPAVSHSPASSHSFSARWYAQFSRSQEFSSTLGKNTKQLWLLLRSTLEFCLFCVSPCLEISIFSTRQSFGNDRDYAWRLERRASAAARVSSFLQNVNRTCEAPSRGSL